MERNFTEDPCIKAKLIPKTCSYISGLTKACKISFQFNILMNANWLHFIQVILQNGRSWLQPLALLAVLDDLVGLGSLR